MNSMLTLDHEVTDNNDYQVQLSLNSYLQHGVLFVDGKPSTLRDQKALVQLFIATQSLVCTSLSEILLEKFNLSILGNEFENTGDEAWRTYARLVLQLHTATEDEATKICKELIIYCLVADLVHSIKSLTVSRDELKVMEYLAFNGGNVIGCTIEKMKEYAEWEKWNEQFGIVARLEGNAIPNPLPKPVQLSLPWLGDLGIDLGDSDQLSVFFRNSADLIVDIEKKHAYVVVSNKSRMTIPSSTCEGLLKLFSENSKGDQNMAEAFFGTTFEDSSYNLRVQKVEKQVAFRIYS
jgi:hypothetical protein